MVFCVDPILPGSGALHPGKTWPLFDIHKYGNQFVFIKMDCRSYFKSSDVQFDYVLHLAAVVGGRLTIENNPLLVADDLSIDAAFWQWAAKGNAKKVIYFSSSAAYPIDLQGKLYSRALKESDICLDDPAFGIPDMSYGWAKLTGEYLAQLAYKHYHVPSICYRPFSGYGEDQDLAYPVPAICKRALEHDNQESNGRFHIWGSGQQSRDFIHIDDIVTGVVKTMDQINDATPLNLSTGIGTNFIHLADKVLNIVNKAAFIETEPGNKPEGVFCRVGCTHRQKDYGFIPNISLEEGLTRVINFLRNNV